MREYTCPVCQSTFSDGWKLTGYEASADCHVTRRYCCLACVAVSAVDHIVIDHEAELHYVRQWVDRDSETIKRLRAALPRRKRYSV